MPISTSQLRCCSRGFLNLSIAGVVVLLSFTVLLNREQVFASVRLTSGGSQSYSTSTTPVQAERPFKVTPPTPWRTARPSNASSDWTFVASKDAENYGLSEAECGKAFPEFAKEVDRARNFWNGTWIRPSDLDISWKESGIVRALIYDRRLYVLEHKFSGAGYNIHRTLAVLGSIHRAVESSVEQIPNVEFSFSVNDIADTDGGSLRKPVWTFSRLNKDQHQWLMPDFGFWSWGLDLVGEYSQIRNQMQQNEKPLQDKIDRLLWRGAENSDIRSSLLKVTAPHRSDWADVESVSWSGRTTLSTSSKEAAISIPEHCKWKLLMHTEGVSYSGRGKYLLNCHSVFVAHELKWIENWHHLLISKGPHQNFVQVKRDLSDLSSKVGHLLANSKDAERIADNSIAMFRDRHLTPAAQACYWRALLRAWRDVSFEPSLYDDMNEMDEAGLATDSASKLRGTPYETFVLTAFDETYNNCSWFRKLIGSC